MFKVRRLEKKSKGEIGVMFFYIIMIIIAVLVLIVMLTTSNKILDGLVVLGRRIANALLNTIKP